MIDLHAVMLGITALYTTAYQYRTLQYKYKHCCMLCATSMACKQQAIYQSATD